jgi:predicted DNA-binding transcriptional regulator AlpA
MTTQIADLIGLTEIAEMYGVTKNVASGWTRKHDFPNPVHTLRMGPMWDQHKVRAWKTPELSPLGKVTTVSCQHCGTDRFVYPRRQRTPEPRALLTESPDQELMSLEVDLFCKACERVTTLILHFEDSYVTINTEQKDWENQL